MIRNFFATPNIIGKLMIALLFVGGVVYAGAFDGFIVETEASCCCGGETDITLYSSSSCCAEYKCNRKSSGSDSKYCSTFNGTHTRKCTHDCSGPGDRGLCGISGC